MSVPRAVAVRGIAAVIGRVAVLTLLAGCSAPPALRPAVQRPLQGAWQGVPTALPMAAAPPPAAAWWQAFHDPVLDRLIREGLEHNLDLKLAQARILQARAARGAAAAALWPQVSAAADDQFTHLPATLSNGTAPKRVFEAALDANWNLDVFGAARNQRRAAEALLQASEFDRDAVRLSLVGAIAGTYVEYRLYQLQCAISARSAESQAGTVRITRARYEQGAASRLDLERVESQLAITRAAVPQALEQAESARSLLILLLAGTPQALSADLPAEIPQDPQLPVGDPLTVLLTPSEVIAQRPDIRRAERQLRAAAANLKSAQALRFPQLSLAALFGTEGTAVHQLMTRAARTYSYGAALTTPLIDFGRIRAGIDAADAQQLQAYLTYEQTVRAALQATQSAIVMYAQGVLREQQLQAALDSARTAARLARTQYQEGALALLDVLDAERTAYDTELTWSQSAAAVSERLIGLYQAMGVLPV